MPQKKEEKKMKTKPAEKKGHVGQQHKKEEKKGKK